MRFHIATLAIIAQTASAQFEFNPGTYSSSELFDIISGYYVSYASIWEGQLTSARASLPGAYMQLTSIFNTDQIPESFNPAFVSKLVQELVEIGHTTVVDAQIDSNTLIFTLPPSSSQSTPAVSQTRTTEAESSPSPTQASETTRKSVDNDVFTLITKSTLSSENSEPNKSGSTTNASRSILYTAAVAALSLACAAYSF
ncbi:hypothetical protein BX661DRAFT_179507 [Kickxella alabastrina]|uniref:uncharacterized protein n=1 Tax=Kickxella alabastrina TaxID=61397 RepID=UPI00222053A4|nr:uncharacterized protein BX661DRAFT_179507 [Kickxella alabastrina]KAI7831917.1 hypothetical protein BX661DRAFT_179507 [Kickxella alabastrina]